MNRFTIEIPNERAETYRLITFIVITLNFFGFGYIFLQSHRTLSSSLAVAAIVFNAVPWIYYLLNKKHLRSPAIEITGIASAFMWMYFGNYLLGILLMIFTVFGFFASKKREIIFSDEGILFPSFPEKKYNWEEVSQAILKDDILTIDLMNNKLIQTNISEEGGRVNVKQFNDFCMQMLQNGANLNS